MTYQLLTIVTIQIYWFSLLFIGHAFAKKLSEIATRNKRSHLLSKIYKRQGVAEKIVISLTIAFTIFSCVAPFLYVFQLPSAYAVLYYLLMVIGAAVLYGRVWLSGIRHLPKALASYRQIPLRVGPAVAAVIGILLIDYLLSLYVGAFSRGDAIFHMSRVANMVHNGFNIHTGFMSDVQESAYHFNVVYVLYLISAKLFNIDPIFVWEYSLAFFRLMLLLALIVFYRYVSRRWLRMPVANPILHPIALIAVLAVTAGVFFTANYPNTVALIWMVAYVIVLDYFHTATKTQVALLTVIGLLIGSTHPTYSLILGIFTIWFLAVKAFRDGLKRLPAQLLRHAPNLTALAVSPVITAMLAKGITSSQQNLLELDLVHLGPLYFINPLQGFLADDYFGWLLFCFGMGATAVLLIKLWHRRELMTVVALVTLYPLIAYTPLFMAINSILPVWVIERFRTINLLAYICVAVVITWMLVRYPPVGQKTASKKLIHINLGIALVIGVATLVLSVGSYRQFIGYGQFNRETYQYYRTVKATSGYIGSQKTVLANMTHSYLLAGILPVDVVAVEQGHSPVRAATDDRIRCQQRMLSTFTLADLRTTNVDYILIPINAEGDSDSQRAIAATKPYIHFVKTTPYYFVYSVDRSYSLGTDRSTAYESCNYRLRESH